MRSQSGAKGQFKLHLASDFNYFDLSYLLPGGEKRCLECFYFQLCRVTRLIPNSQIHKTFTVSEYFQICLI